MKKTASLFFLVILLLTVSMSQTVFAYKNEDLIISDSQLEIKTDVNESSKETPITISKNSVVNTSS